MARPKGTKNVMRSPEEKEMIILEIFDSGTKRTAEKYGISRRLLHTWISKYHRLGISSLKSQTGKQGHRRGRPVKPIDREQVLELGNLKLKIEVERLKKGYLVKGVGTKKEYVIIKELNTKS